MNVMRIHQSRRAFSLIEVLVVISVIGALAGIGIPAWFAMRTQARIGSARALVVAVRSAMAAYELKSWQVVGRDPASASTFGRLQRVDPDLWDLNHDEIIDGRPGLDTATAFPADVHDTGKPQLTTYSGFYDMVGMSLPKRSGLNAARQVLDPWGMPLRIRFFSATGADRIGVWSCGPDKSPSTSDDICTWK